VDDNIGRANNQRIVRAAEAKGVVVHQLTSTADALAFLQANPGLCRQPFERFRCLSDMGRNEPPPRGEMNKSAGLELVAALQLVFNCKSPTMIYTAIPDIADQNLDGLGLNWVTNEEGVATSFALFELGGLDLRNAEVDVPSLSACGGVTVNSHEKSCSDVVIKRPKSSSNSMAAQLFRSVESQFMAFTSKDLASQYFLVSAVHVFHNPATEGEFQCERKKMNAGPSLVEDGLFADSRPALSDLKRIAGLVQPNSQKREQSAPVLAWHGTGDAHTKNILHHGVQMSKVGKLGAWHGRGFYTTTRPGYAEEYVKFSGQEIPKHETRRLMLCWVLAGRPFLVTDSSQNGETTAPLGFHSNYALVQNFHAKPIGLDDASGDELCSFAGPRILPMFVCEYSLIQPHFPLTQEPGFAREHPDRVKFVSVEESKAAINSFARDLGGFRDVHARVATASAHEAAEQAADEAVRGLHKVQADFSSWLRTVGTLLLQQSEVESAHREGREVWGDERAIQGQLGSLRWQDSDRWHQWTTQVVGDGRGISQIVDEASQIVDKARGRLTEARADRQRIMAFIAWVDSEMCGCLETLSRMLFDILMQEGPAARVAQGIERHQRCISEQSRQRFAERNAQRTAAKLVERSIVGMLVPANCSEREFGTLATAGDDDFFSAPRDGARR
jgi:hypothetical protein